MLGLHGKPSDLEVFRFQLAELLGKTLGEIDQMPYPEYVEWAGYLEAKAAIQEVRNRGR